MTEFKVGDKVGFSVPYWRGQEGTIQALDVTKDVLSVRVPGSGNLSFKSHELELITPAPAKKDVWEWLVEQSYLSEHDGKQAKAEYEAFHKGVDALPTEVGWYESGVLPLRDGYNPYRLEWGIWFALTDEGYVEAPHEEMLELMPLTQLGAEAGEEQA